MRDGATFIPSLQDSDLGAHVCTRHRALARRYTELNMSWTYPEPRQPLDNPRASNGRFGSLDLLVSGLAIPPGSDAAVITVFKDDFLDQQPIDWHLAESGTTCPICLDEEDPVTPAGHVRLQCGHGIHMRCLSEFVLSGAVDLSADTVPCPLCRGDILPDIVQLRHHLLHMKVVDIRGRRASHPLRDLVFEDGHDPTMIDEEIRAYCIPPGPVKYVSSKNPTVICDNWTDLGLFVVPDPTQEITDMLRPSTPIRAPTPPAAEETTPPVFVNLVDSPPRAPRPDRRVRRRLDQPVQFRHVVPMQYPQAHLVTLGRGQVARAEEIPNNSARAIGVNLTEIMDQSRAGTGVFHTHGHSASGDIRYTLSVVDVLTDGRTQRQLNLMVDDVNVFI